MTAFITITRVVTHDPRESRADAPEAHLSYHYELINVDAIARVLENRVIYIGDTEAIVGQLVLHHTASNHGRWIDTDETAEQLTDLIAQVAPIVGLNEDRHAYLRSVP